MTSLAQRWVRFGAMAVLAPAAVSLAGSLAGSLAVSLAGSLALAQQPSAAPRTQNSGQQPAAAAKAAPGRDAAAAAGLRQRVEQLEEQLVDIQVVIGTLESLAKGVTAPVATGQRPSPGVAAAISASDAGRLDALETQIRAMAAQLEQMQEHIRALQAGAPPAPTANAYGAAPHPGGLQGKPALPERTGFGAVVVSPDARSNIASNVGPNVPNVGSEAGANAAPDDPGSNLGPTGKDAINRLLQEPRGAPGGAAPPNEAEDAGSKQLYETAYGYLLQRDYGAAEAAFDAFLKRHPNDPLAGNAQYWLGESLYVRGQYRAAAGAFLKGYQSYTHSAKAPESLLKLAMSLQRLGQKDAACSSYGELSSKFPNAPAHVKSSAQVERQRAGC